MNDIEKCEKVLQLVNQRVKVVRKKTKSKKLADKFERVSKSKLEVGACAEVGIDYFDYCNFIDKLNTTI